MKKALVVTITSLLAVTGTAAPVAATGTTAKKYANCDALLKAYPNGVAKSPKARRTAVREGFAKPEVSKTLYKANGARLDRDKDGVMCEQAGSSRGSREPFPDLIGSAMQKPWCEGELLRVGDVAKLSPACVLVLYGN